MAHKPAVSPCLKLAQLPIPSLAEGAVAAAVNPSARAAAIAAAIAAAKVAESVAGASVSVITAVREAVPGPFLTASINK